jgi:hypothetical protein
MIVYLLVCSLYKVTLCLYGSVQVTSNVVHDIYDTSCQPLSDVMGIGAWK